MQLRFLIRPRLAGWILCLAVLAFAPEVCAASQGGPVTKLNSPLEGGGDVQAFALVPGGARVLYLADQDTDGQTEVYVVPSSGGAVTKLNVPLAASEYVVGAVASPDGGRVLYWVKSSTQADVLYSVQIQGGPSTPLSALQSASAFIASYVFSPDSTRVVYRARDGTYELYSVPIDGSSPPTKLNPPLVTGAAVRQFGVSADGSRVVYSADLEIVGLVEIYSVAIDGGASTKLSSGQTELPLGGGVFEISPDSTRVVYGATQGPGAGYELFSVPILGGPSTRLCLPLAIGRQVQGHLISPEGKWVVYRADQDTFQVYELFSVPIGGGTPVKLHPPLVTGNTLYPTFAITPDSTRVVFAGDLVTSEIGIFSSPIDASSPFVQLNPPQAEAGVTFRISPNSAWVVYTHASRLGRYELFSVPTTGGASTRINGELPLGSSARFTSFEIHASSKLVGYILDQGAFSIFELFANRISGGQSRRLSAPLVPGGDVKSFAFGTGTQVFYLADQEVDEVMELFVTRLAN